MLTRSPHTLDFAELRLTLRPGLRWDHQEFAGGPCVVIEDPLGEAFFRIGMREAEFLRLLDGTRTVREVVATLAERHPEAQLSLDDATRIGDWLLTHRLASPSDRIFTVGDAGPLLENRGLRADPTWNPLTFRVPLGRPNWLLDRLTPWLGWCFGPLGFALWLVAAAGGALTLAGRWPEFLANAPAILDGARAWRLGMAFVGLKVLHELAHAMVCRRHGGTVGNVGIYFLLFSPLPYVDVTSTWRMASKWRRIHVSIAGVYAELFVAAIALWIWGHSPDPLTRQTAMEVFLLGSVATLVVNANPLMRFDGYFVLTDLVGIPNLNSRGRRAVSEVIERLFVAPRCRAQSGEPRGWDGVALAGYGLSCLVWGQLVTWGLVVAMAAFWEGAGALLATFAILAWYGPVVSGMWQHARRQQFFRRLAWGRLAISSAAVAGGSVLLWHAPLPDWRGAAGVVALPVGCEVRVATPGIIQEIRVSDGQLVQAGEVLLRLRNPELSAELADVEDQLEKARVESRRHLRQQRIAIVQADEAVVASLEARRSQLERQVSELIVTAPRSGRVVAPRLADRQETHLVAGDDVLAIHPPGAEEIHLSLDQRQATEYRRQTGSTVLVRIPGFESSRLPCELIEVEPRGAASLPHWSLSAAVGGEIAVSPVEASGTRDPTVMDGAANRRNGASDWEATEAYFTARLRPRFPLPVGVPLGLRCQARLEHSPQTLGDWLRDSIWGEASLVVDRSSIQRWFAERTTTKCTPRPLAGK